MRDVFKGEVSRVGCVCAYKAMTNETETPQEPMSGRDWALDGRMEGWGKFDQTRAMLLHGQFSTPVRLSHSQFNPAGQLYRANCLVRRAWMHAYYRDVDESRVLRQDSLVYRRRCA
jgi:hypothetical protein